MNSITTTFLGLLQSFKSTHYNNGVPKGRGNEQMIHKKSGKTRRGATHKHGSVFLGRKILSVTHSEFRRQHKGVVTRTPDYKLKHAAPKWRNRKWISA